ncbi:lactonase family protein [Symbioplanes lichenis]|uniref:lactonase family protein n=1 Tax=Symbioplanes lichenis TaxID=1629072 RepID=UPI002739DD6C|nr:lactonase family protein [Actinoplanes lichenis]
MAAHDEFVFFGCYTGETGGRGEGIVLARRDPATGALSRLGVAARTPSPSFVIQHPALPVIYAVNELTAGTVSAFALGDDASLTPLAVRATGGADPCHLAVAPGGTHLLVANYSSGSVAVFPLDVDGVPGERSDLLTLTGSGPVTDRQEGPHAHMVAPDPHGPDVLVCDLGSDHVWHTRLDRVSGRLTLVGPAVTTDPGTGPRHLLRTADGALLLVGELAGELSWFRRGADGGLAREGREPTSAGKPNQPSEVTTGRDGRFVYVGNRGPDTVGVFAWDGHDAVPVAEVATGGEWPRHLALLSDHLYVANERSHTVTIFRVDPDSGIPVAPGESVTVNSPTCILRARVRDEIA